MAARYRSSRSRIGYLPTRYSHSTGYRHAHHRAGSFSGLLVFVIIGVAAVITVVIAISAIFSATSDVPSIKGPYPKPEGYELHGTRIQTRARFCVDPRDGPAIDWALVDLARDVVARLRSAAPSLPLEISGICDSAGGDAHGEGRISWRRMSGYWGMADGREIVLNPDIAPPSWECVGRVLTHEFGHLAGLAHQQPGIPSIMNPGGCGHQFTLFDVAALRYLYENHSSN